MTIMVFGIDPGLSGAVACYIPERQDFYVSDFPTVMVKKRGQKVRAAIDYPELTHDLWPINGWAELAVVEYVSAMPGQGVAGMFRFGEAYGAAKAFAYRRAKRVFIVTPRKWKEALGCPTDKDEAREFTIEKFPRAASILSRKKDHGRAEALLLAYYGWELLRAGK